MPFYIDKVISKVKESNKCTLNLLVELGENGNKEFDISKLTVSLNKDNLDYYEDRSTTVLGIGAGMTITPANQ